MNPSTHLEGDYRSPSYNNYSRAVILGCSRNNFHSHITDKIHSVAVNACLLVSINTTHGQSGKIIICEDEIISLSWTWDKEKIWVPSWQDSNLSSPKHRAGALSTELRRTHGERGHILGSYLTCVLHTARISAMSRSYCLVKEWKMVKFTIFHSFTNHYMVF